jgi:prepilin-type processing-associated H-X9-DG protein
MSSSPRFTPTAVKAPHGATVMKITWADGHVSELPHEILRGYCPCAHCQGHGGTTTFVPGGNLDIRGIEQVGNYAFCLTWGDQHDTGIYSYRYLRALCQCAECAAHSEFKVPS